MLPTFRTEKFSNVPLVSSIESRAYNAGLQCMLQMRCRDEPRAEGSAMHC